MSASRQLGSSHTPRTEFSVRKRHLPSGSELKGGVSEARPQGDDINRCHIPPMREQVKEGVGLDFWLVWEALRLLPVRTYTEP